MKDKGENRVGYRENEEVKKPKHRIEETRAERRKTPRHEEKGTGAPSTMFRLGDFLFLPQYQWLWYRDRAVT
jgi:hypothetical protein